MLGRNSKNLVDKTEYGTGDLDIRRSLGQPTKSTSVLYFCGGSLLILIVRRKVQELEYD